MDIRHLQTFQAILDEGNFARAALTLNYGQSTVTLHIQQLEAELGTPLFIRRGRKLKLTEAGTLLSQRSQHILQQLTALGQHIQDLTTGEAGLLRIGCIEPAASLRLLPLLKEVRQQHPKLNLTLEVAGTPIIAEQVAKGELDIGICTPPPPHLQLRFEPLFTEELVVLLPQHHSLLESETLTLAQLAREPLLVTEKTCAYRKMIEATFLERGLTPLLNTSISSSWALRQAIQLGMGIGLMPRLAVTPPPKGTRVRELTDVSFHLSVGMVQRHDEVISQAGQAFQKVVRERLAARGANKSRRQRNRK
jgi:LysR family transcriptional regulator, regulator of the ytmI operon